MLEEINHSMNLTWPKKISLINYVVDCGLCDSRFENSFSF